MSQPQYPFPVGVAAALAERRAGRLSWNGAWVVLMPSLSLPPNSSQEPGARVNDRTARHIGADTPLNSQPYLAQFDPVSGEWRPGWVPTQADMSATDWVIMDEDPPPQFPPPPKEKVT